MDQREVRLSGLKPTTVAMFEGVFGAIIGLGVALMYMIGGIGAYSAATNSLLQGLLLGMSIGVFAIIVLPAVYFAIGWVIGIVHGYVLNIVLRSSGGIVLDVSQMDDAAPAYSRGQAEPAFGERIERRPRK